jgi:hypothetical protein
MSLIPKRDGVQASKGDDDLPRIVAEEASAKKPSLGTLATLGGTANLVQPRGGAFPLLVRIRL